MRRSKLGWPERLISSPPFGSSTQSWLDRSELDPGKNILSYGGSTWLLLRPRMLAARLPGLSRWNTGHAVNGGQPEHVPI